MTTNAMQYRIICRAWFFCGPADLNKSRDFPARPHNRCGGLDFIPKTAFLHQKISGFRMESWRFLNSLTLLVFLPIYSTLR